MSEAPFDFNAYLEKSADEVKRPKPVPAGTYMFLVKGKEFGFSSQKKTPQVEFELVPQSAEADVDLSELDGRQLSEMSVYETFYLTAKAEFRLLDFAQACGVNTQGRKLLEVVNACVNQYVKAHVKVNPNTKDPTKPGYNEITSVSPAV